MIHITSRRRVRPGFTLVELLVSVAIIIIIMVILSTCFRMALDTMREMRAVGDLTDQLRSAETVIRRDLEVPHFVPEPGNQSGLLSDQKLDAFQIDPATKKVTGWRPPKAGFFRIRSTQGIPEGFDADGLASTRATDHYLHFTSIVPDRPDVQPYSAVVNVSGSQQRFNSRAAEIALFLDPQPSGNTGGGSPLNLHRLVRRQRLVALNEAYRGDFAAAATAGDRAVISTRLNAAATGLDVNALTDLTDPNNRLGGQRNAGSQTNLAGPILPTGSPSHDGEFGPLVTRPGDDVLVSNVISFNVRVVWVPAASATLPPKLPYVRRPNQFVPGTTMNSSTDFPFDFLPAVPAAANPMAVGPDPAHTAGNTVLAGQPIFDTWSAARTGWDAVDSTTGELTPSADTPPLLIRIQGVQIQIRVWDAATETTRQVTIVQEL